MTTQLKERPVIFTTEEVSAVLAGNKTHYRVPVLTSEQVAAGYKCCYGVASGQVIFTKDESDKSFVEDGYINVECALGSIGDRLWVQEPTLAIEDVGWIGPVFVASDAGRNAIDWGYGPYDDPAHIPACELNYNKPDDLSYEDSRLLLEITDIRIERVRDIDAASAEVEGCFDFSGYERLKPRPLSAFITYWMAKHGDDAWFTNPWVWVIEFKKVND